MRRRLPTLGSDCVMCIGEPLLVRTLSAPDDGERVDVDIPLCGKHAVDEPACDCGELMSECMDTMGCWVSRVVIQTGIAQTVHFDGVEIGDVVGSLRDAWRVAYRIAREHIENPPQTLTVSAQVDEAELDAARTFLRQVAADHRAPLREALDQGVRDIRTYRTPDGELRRVSLDGEGRAVGPVDPDASPTPAAAADDACGVEDHCGQCEERESECTCEEGVSIGVDHGTKPDEAVLTVCRRAGEAIEVVAVFRVGDRVRLKCSGEAGTVDSILASGLIGVRFDDGCEGDGPAPWFEHVEESAGAATPVDAEPPGPAQPLPRGEAAQTWPIAETPAPSGHDHRTAGDVAAERDRDLREGPWREVTLGEVRDLFPAGVYERQVDGGVALVGLDGGPAVHHLGVASTQADVLRALGNAVIARRGRDA